MTEREEFEAAMADECPEFQRDIYMASDVESNVRAVAWSIWQAARRTTPDRQAWISVNESVPQTADFVLAVNKLGAIKCIQYWHGEWIGMGGVTHWMPLPTAPNGEQS